MSDSLISSLHEIYGIAEKLADTTEFLAHIVIPKSIDGLVIVLPPLMVRLVNLDWKLGSVASTCLEWHIIKSRQNKPVEFLGEYPNALRAVMSLAMTIRYAALDNTAPDCDSRTADIGSEVFWRQCCHDHFVRAGLDCDKKWEAFYERFQKRLPDFSWQKLKTILALERAAAEDAAMASTPLGGKGKPKSKAEAAHDKSELGERLQQYLAENPDSCSSEDVGNAIGIGKWKINHSNDWKAHKDKLLDNFLRNSKSQVTLEVVKEKFGWESPTVSQMEPWKKYRERLTPKKKEKQLNQCTIDLKPGETIDPSALMESRENLLQAIIEVADLGTRGAINGLSDPDRDSLIEHLKLMFHGHDFAEMTIENRVAQFLEATKSWLENHDQEKRYGGNR